MMGLRIIAAMSLVAAAGAAEASPALMVQPKDCTVLAGGTNNGPCTPTYNQAGLAVGYVDEGTDLHPYTATTTHTLVFQGNEWFGTRRPVGSGAGWHIAG